MGMTVLQIADRLRSEADAYLFMEHLRWGDGEPKCSKRTSLRLRYTELTGAPLSSITRREE